MSLHRRIAEGRKVGCRRAYSLVAEEDRTGQQLDCFACSVRLRVQVGYW